MRTILRTLLAALMATLLTLTAAPAYAHDELVSSTLFFRCLGKSFSPLTNSIGGFP